MERKTKRRDFLKTSVTGGVAGGVMMANFGRNLEAAVKRQNLFSSPSEPSIFCLKNEGLTIPLSRG